MRTPEPGEHSYNLFDSITWAEAQASMKRVQRQPWWNWAWLKSRFLCWWYRPGIKRLSIWYEHHKITNRVGLGDQNKGSFCLAEGLPDIGPRFGDEIRYVPQAYEGWDSENPAIADAAYARYKEDVARDRIVKA